MVGESNQYEFSNERDTPNLTEFEYPSSRYRELTVYEIGFILSWKLFIYCQLRCNSHTCSIKNVVCVHFMASLIINIFQSENGPTSHELRKPLVQM